MIDYIIPIPHRAKLLGLSIDGLVDSFGILSNSVKAAISREVAVLPIRFYKIMSHWGGFSCEHVVATDLPVDVVNMNKNQGNIIPISVKMKKWSNDFSVDHTYLFVNGISYLLTKYPKQWEGDDFIPTNSVIRPIGVTKLQAISLWAMELYHKFCEMLPPGDVLQIPDQFQNSHAINRNDPCWNLIEVNDHSALSIATVISDGCLNQDDLVRGIQSLIYDITNAQSIGVQEFFTLEFHRFAQIDPLTKIFLKNPWFSNWADLLPYIPTDASQRLSWWNLAMSQANATINFNGSTLPLLTANGDWDVFQFISMVQNTGITDFCVEVNGGCRPKIAINDLNYYGTQEQLQGFADILGNYLCQMFISLHDTPQYLKGRSVTITKTFLDEIFIVVEGTFGRYCYYVSLPYYCLTSPVLCNC